MDKPVFVLKYKKVYQAKGWIRCLAEEYIQENTVLKSSEDFVVY